MKTEPENTGARRPRQLTLAAAAVLLVIAGCSKPPARQPAQAARPARRPADRPAARPAPPRALPAPAPAPMASAPAGSRELDQLAATYLATPAIPDRLRIIGELSEADDPVAAVGALHKVFRQETDPELKQTMLDALQDIDGATPAKLELLREAIQPGQPAAVRLSGIDELTVLAAPQVTKILLPLLSDPDDDVREAAQDAFEGLQSKQ